MLKIEGDANTYMQYEVAGHSDKGKVRPRNEDCFGYYIPDKKTNTQLGSLFVVSDGVGGHVAGEVASAEAVNVLLQEYYFGNHSEKIPQRLREAVCHAGLHIFDLGASHSAFHNMQCTLTSLLLRQNQYHIAHVGDSKAFLLRAGAFTQLTKDHSLVSKLVRMGFVSKDEAKSHPYKHALLRALGEKPIFPVDVYSGNFLPGDLYCLITDGILEHISEEELHQGLLKNGKLDDILNQLISIVNQRGGTDNMTILAVRIREVI